MATARPRGIDRSRIVAALKLILPLTALGLLSMVFWLASPVDPSRALATAEIDVADRARDPRLSAARFAGVTADGQAIRVEARAARSDPGGALRFRVEGLVVTLGEGGPRGPIVLQAEAGELDRAGGGFQMAGDVRIQAEPGYDLTASRIDGLLDRTHVMAQGPVAGQAPGGAVQAGAMEVTAGAGGTYRLVFRDGVRLIYQTLE